MVWQICTGQDHQFNSSTIKQQIQVNDSKIHLLCRVGEVNVCFVEPWLNGLGLKAERSEGENLEFIYQQ